MSGSAAAVARKSKRDSPVKNMPPIAYGDGMVFLEDTPRQSYLGICLVGYAIGGVSEQTFDRIKAVASASLPGGTFIQISMASTPDVDNYARQSAAVKSTSIASSPYIREDQRELLFESVRTQTDFYLSGKSKPHIKESGMRLHVVHLTISVKIRTAAMPTESDEKLCREKFDKFEQGLATAGFGLTRASVGNYLQVLRSRFNPFAPGENWYDENRELRRQILPPGTEIDDSDSKELVFEGAENIHVRLLSPKRMPNFMSAGLMDYFQGDPGGINNQVPLPWAITLSIHLPNPIKKRNWVENKFRQLTFQASQGNIVKWAPRLAQKKADIDVLKADIDNGDPPCEMNLTMALYSKDRDELNRVSSQVSTYLSGYQVDMVEDSQILWPLFWNSLPLYPSPTSISNLDRYWSMSMGQALQFMPVSSDWLGSGPGATMLLETRRSQPFSFDLYASETNYNGLLFAQSGAGKSVFLNYLIMNYLAEGARIWVTDIGRSYYKTAKALGGEFISFNEDSNICLNPFTNVVDIDDEMDLLAALLSKMAAPMGGLDDYLTQRLKEGIKAVWGSKGNLMTVSDVANWADLQDDARVKDLAHLLFPYTSRGQFGLWFEGKNNLNFKSNFVVLELEELNQKPDLQKVVLMILMAKIQHEMYLKMDGGKKLAIFDEAWALFEDDGVARFLNHAFRRFRKYEGACIVAVQNIADFYLRKDMQAVAANAAWKIIMRQLPESVDQSVQSGHLALDPYGVSQLKTVHTSATGAYSELMVLAQSGAWSIARLVLPAFLKVLFSTKGDARNVVIADMESGMPPREAVHRFMAARGMAD